MRITILVVGSRGDVQPFVALGLGLQAVGHQVRLATHSTFAAFARSYGLEFFPIEGNPRDMLSGEKGQEWLESGRNPLRFARDGISILAPLLARLFADSWAACQDAEAIISATFALAGPHIAEKLGIPSYVAYLQPISRTRAFPSMSISPGRNLGGPLNALTYRASEQLFWQIVRQPVNRWRQESLNLPPIPFSGLFSQMAQQRRPILYAYSPSVLPKPADWGDWIHVTGYWFLERQNGWQPPDDLAGFLDDGPPPVYVGFGSMTPRDARELAETAVTALQKTGQRGILSTGWGGLEQETLNLPDDVLVVDQAPHDWLFPRMAAVVHHGGAGTMAAGLRAGVPTVTVPFFFDQPFWGQQVARLGAGPPPIPHKQITAVNLAAAIHRVVTDERMRARAAELGRRIRAEDGVATAVQRIK